MAMTMSDFDRAVEFAGCMVHHQPRWADGTEGRSWCLAHRRLDTWPCHETVRVLALIREVRADTLASLAAEMEAPGWHHMDNWGVPVIYPNALQERAEKHREAT